MRDQTRIVLSLDTINSLDHVASDSADAACGGSARLSASDIRSHAIHEMRRTQSPRRRRTILWSIIEVRAEFQHPREN
jgi:hypothetical protein